VSRVSHRLFIKEGNLIADAEQSADHLYPVQKIMRDPRFGKLSPLDQEKILELQEKYYILPSRANSSKLNRSMAEWFKTPIGSQIPDTFRQALLDAEAAGKQAVEDFFSQRIKNATDLPK
jgi:hypothetical protein